MNRAILIAVAATSVNLLVLRSGERIPVADLTRTGERIVFHTPDGRLFSLPESELSAIVDDAPPVPSQPPSQPPSPPAPETRRLRGTESERRRLIAELEQNHAGKFSPEAERLPAVPDSPSPDTDEEWRWRNRARALEESIRRARENRDLLAARADGLREHILSLMSLGYRPSQFTYDSAQLTQTLEQIPAAELEVTRAARAWDEFRDEARRRGIMPGWLR